MKKKQGSNVAGGIILKDTRPSYTPGKQQIETVIQDVFGFI